MSGKQQPYNFREVTKQLEDLDCDLFGYDTVLSGGGDLCYGTFVTACKNTRFHDSEERKSPPMQKFEISGNYCHANIICRMGSIASGQRLWNPPPSPARTIRRGILTCRLSKHLCVLN
jgi:hypothetical protein